MLSDDDTKLLSAEELKDSLLHLCHEDDPNNNDLTSEVLQKLLDIPALMLSNYSFFFTVV